MTERTILLITSNGFGMGHLVRQLAIANALGDRVHIMTLSQAAPVAVKAGATLEYCPSYTTAWIGKRAWHRGYLRDRIVALAEELRADVVAFDGVVPYVGLLDALQRLDVARVWIRRGVWRANATPAPLAYSPMFDLIIEPGDLGSPRDAGPTHTRTDAARIGVVTQAGPTAMLPRSEAAARLGIDAGKLTVLFNVGSNAIPGLDAVMTAIAHRANVNVLTTKDALGRNRSASAVHAVSDLFPLYPYLSAIDLAVTSVGYNAAHEFVGSGVPTVLVPADNVTDDQRARAYAMQDVGVGVVVNAHDVVKLQETIERLLDDEDERSVLAHAARAIAASWGNGAAEAAALLRSVVPVRRRNIRARMLLTARLLAERLLGAFDQQSRASGAVFAHDLTAELLRSDQAVEHLLPKRSDAYAARRREIARKWFGNA